MTEIDIDKIGAHAGPKVILGQSIIVSGAGAGTPLAGFSGLDGVYVEVTVDLRDRHKGDPSLMISLDQSTDGESFASAHDFNFVAPGVLAFTLTSPDDQLRISWDVGGGSEWNIRQVLVAPVSINEGGGGGSSITDDVFEFQEADGAVTSYPIVAVDLDAQTIEIAGDHSEEFEYTLLRITGSTGNDGDYIADTATYDSGSGRTTLTIDEGVPITDATVDGDAQPPVIYSAEVELGDNTAVEWIFIRTTAEWAASEAYLLIGDSDDDGFFVTPSADVHAVASWQWPEATLQDSAQSVNGNGLQGYVLYPNGTTVKVKLGALNSGDTTGRTTIIVHHHLTEQGEVPTRIPVA